jgi:prepilin-type N-terminal cleavage/methylation domain-containing protein
MMSRIRKENGGFSLIEIIVTIAIMSVLVGAMGYSYSMVSGRGAEECARKLASTLSHARTTSMGKYSNIITIKNTGSSIIVNEDIFVKYDEEGKKVETKRESTVGKSNVTVMFKYNSDGEYEQLVNDGTIEFHFNSSTGALITAKDDVSQLYFKISKGKTEKFVVINSLTGKVSVGNSEDVANYES